MRRPTVPITHHGFVANHGTEHDTPRNPIELAVLAIAVEHAAEQIVAVQCIVRFHKGHQIGEVVVLNQRAIGIFRESAKDHVRRIRARADLLPQHFLVVILCQHHAFVRMLPVVQYRELRQKAVTACRRTDLQHRSRGKIEIRRLLVDRRGPLIGQCVVHRDEEFAARHIADKIDTACQIGIREIHHNRLRLPLRAVRAQRVDPGVIIAVERLALAEKEAVHIRHSFRHGERGAKCLCFPIDRNQNRAVLSPALEVDRPVAVHDRVVQIFVRLDKSIDCQLRGQNQEIRIRDQIRIAVLVRQKSVDIKPTVFVWRKKRGQLRRFRRHFTIPEQPETIRLRVRRVVVLHELRQYSPIRHKKRVLHIERIVVPLEIAKLFQCAFSAGRGYRVETGDLLHGIILVSPCTMLDPLVRAKYNIVRGHLDKISERCVLIRDPDRRTAVDIRQICRCLRLGDCLRFRLSPHRCFAASCNRQCQKHRCHTERKDPFPIPFFHMLSPFFSTISGCVLHHLYKINAKTTRFVPANVQKSYFCHNAQADVISFVQPDRRFPHPSPSKCPIPPFFRNREIAFCHSAITI